MSDHVVYHGGSIANTKIRLMALGNSGSLYCSCNKDSCPIRLHSRPFDGMCCSATYSSGSTLASRVLFTRFGSWTPQIVDWTSF